MKLNPYKTLAVTVGIHFFIMLALTYVGVFQLNHIYLNLNRFYMAVVMVATMVILMLLSMHHMYENKKLNLVLYAVFGLLFIGTFFAIRDQTFVGDRQFLKSMIPHHSVAIKTCEYADLSDPEIKQLCEEIIQLQREEIEQMEGILERLESGESVRN